MRKQKTFESQYAGTDTNATEWLHNLSLCFTIKKATIKTYTKQTWRTMYCCKVIVEFE